MKNRMAFLSGLSLFICFCLLSGAGSIAGLFGESYALAGLAAAQTAAFIIPILLLKLGAPKDQPVRLRTFLKMSSSTVISFTFWSGMAVSAVAFLINYLLYAFGALSKTGSAGITALGAVNGSFGTLCAVVISSAILEEIFLRGALFSVHEKLAGTGFCILLSGFCFAMLHGTMGNFIGPMLAGFLYAYLTYVFDCVWPAIAAHLTNNIFYLLMLWITDTYSNFGIWKYTPGVCLILLLLSIYLAMGALEKLLMHDRLRRFQKQEAGTSVLSAMLNPGFTVFVLAFAAKAIFHLI